MDPIYSKSCSGLAMAVGAVAFISSASEEQNNQGTEGQTQDILQQDQSQPLPPQQQQTRQGSPNNNMTSANATTTMTITKPQGAATQQVQEYYQPNPAMVTNYLEQ